jgi:hypothetical protein
MPSSIYFSSSWSSFLSAKILGDGEIETTFFLELKIPVSLKSEISSHPSCFSTGFNGFLGEILRLGPAAGLIIEMHLGSGGLGELETRSIISARVMAYSNFSLIDWAPNRGSCFELSAFSLTVKVN